MSRPLLIRCAAVLLIVTAGSAAWPQKTREEALVEVRDEIAFLQARLSRLNAETSDLSAEVERIDLAMLLGLERLREAVLASDLAERRLDQLERRVAGLASDVARLRARLRGGLKSLYRLGRGGYARLLFAVNDQDTLLPAIRQMRYFVLRDAERLEQFRSRQVELEFESRELEQEQRRRQGWLEREQTRRQDLFDLQQQKLALLAKVEAESSQLEVATSRLADKERRLSRMLDFLYGRAAGPLEGTPIQEFRGALDWPADGRVTIGFGPRKDPRYKTEVPHNGIELAVSSGAEIRVVFPGKVLYAEPFQGYGLTVIVQHAGGVFSLYADLERLQVITGDVLSLGDVLGSAGRRIYFEIREENSPRNPLSWLR